MASNSSRRSRADESVRVMIRGAFMPPTSRQRELFERYGDLPATPAP